MVCRGEEGSRGSRPVEWLCLVCYKAGAGRSSTSSQLPTRGPRCTGCCTQEGQGWREKQHEPGGTELGFIGEFLIGPKDIEGERSWRPG